MLAFFFYLYTAQRPVPALPPPSSLTLPVVLATPRGRLLPMKEHGAPSGARESCEFGKTRVFILGRQTNNISNADLRSKSLRRSYRDSLPINRASFPVMASWGTDRKQTLQSEIVPPHPPQVPSSCKFAAVSAER